MSGLDSIFVDVLPRWDMAAVQASMDSMRKRYEKFGADLSNAVGLKSSPAATRAFEEQTRQITAAQKAFGDSLTAQSRQSAIAKDAITQQQIAQKRLNDVLEKYEADSAKAMAAQLKLTQATRDSVVQADLAAAATERHEVATAALATAHDGAAAAADRHAARMAALSGTLNTVGTVAIVGVTAAMVAGLKPAADFQQSQMKLVTTASLNKQSLDDVSRGILAMSGQVGVSAQDLSKAMYTVSSGMTHVQDPAKDAANALMILKAGAEGAKQENADLTPVVDAVTTVLKDYHRPAEDAAAVTSMMIAATAQGKTTFDAFATALGQVQAQAYTARESLPDLYAAMAEMTSHGIDAQQSAQNLNRALSTLQKPSADMTTALANVGISSSDLSKDIGKEGLTGTLEDISESIMRHMGPSGTVLVDALNQSKVAAQDTNKAYQALANEGLAQYADQIKSGQLTPNLKTLEGKGLNLTQAGQLQSFGQMYKKSTGLNANLTSLKNSDKNYSQMLQAATGNQETYRVASQLTGENAADVAQKKRAIAAKDDKEHDVAGWDEIQSNYNQRLADVKQSFNSLEIALGGKLLPAADGFMHSLQGMAAYFQQNKSLADVLIKSVGGIAAAAVGIKATNMVGNLFGADHLGGKAVGGALKYGVGKPLQFAGKGVAGVARAAIHPISTAGDIGAWTSLRREAVGNAGRRAGSAIARGGRAVGSAAQDAAAWTSLRGEATGNVLKRGGSQIARAGRAVGGAARTAGSAVVDGASAAADVGASAGKGLASFGKTAASAAKDVGQLTKDKSVAGFIKAWDGMKTAATAVKDFQMGAKLAAAATKTWEIAQAGLNLVMEMNPIGAIIAALVALGVGLYEAYKHSKTFRDIVQDVWNWIKKAGADIGGFFVDAWHDLGHALTWVKENAVDPVYKAFTGFFDGVGTGVTSMVDGFEKQWNRLMGIVGPPVDFIVNTVYNDALEPLWNNVAGIFGAPKLPGHIDFKLENVAKFAGGGVVADGTGVLVPEAARALGIRPSFPGYAPGIDTVPMRTARGMAMFSPGEALVDPTTFGGPQGIWALNNHFSGGRKNANGAQAGTHFAPGGILGGIENLAKSAWHGVVDTGKFLAEVMTDPVGAVKKLLAPALKPVNGAGSSSFGATIAKAPGMAVDSIAKWVMGWVGIHPGAGGNNSALPASIANNQQIQGWIAQAEQLTGVDGSWTNDILRIIARESSGNTHAINLTDSNAKAGDPSKGLMQVIGSTFRAYHQAGTSDDIYDPVANIAAAINYIRGRYHGDHAGAANGVNYAGGGVVGDPMAKIQAHVGTPYGMSGFGPGELDCTGATSMVVNDFLGLPEFGSRMSTPSEGQWLSALGALPGRGGPGDLTAIWWDGGTGGFSNGHSEVILPNGEVAEAGGAHNNFAIGAGTTSPDDPQWKNAMHFPAAMLKGAQTPQGSASGSVTPLGIGSSGGGGSFSTGGSSGGSSSGGSTGGFGALTDMTDPSNWTVHGLGSFLGSSMMNWALGNPVLAQLQAQQAQQSSTSSVSDATTAATSAAMTSAGAAGASATTSATDAATKAQDRLTKAQERYNKVVAKDGASSSQAATARLTVTTAQQALTNHAATSAQTATAAQQRYDNQVQRVTIDQQKLNTAIAKYGQNSKQAISAANTLRSAQTMLGKDKASLGAAQGKSAAYAGAQPAALTMNAPAMNATADGVSTDSTTDTGTDTSLSSGDIANYTSGGGLGVGGMAGGALTAAAAGLGSAGGPMGALAAQFGAQGAMTIANNAIGYAGQVGGDLADGVLETFGLTDPTQSWIGKVATSLGQAHFASPNTAGTASSPAIAKSTDSRGDVHVNIENQHVHGGSGDKVANDIYRKINSKVGAGTR